MATTVNKYIDSSDFLTATAVYDDAALTIPSADGYYQQNGIYRQQSAGVLLAGSTTCPSCSGSSQALTVTGVSATELCCGTSSNYTAFFASGDSFTNASTTLMYADPGLTTVVPDGWYQIKTSNEYRQQLRGSLQPLTNCPTCPSTPDFYISGASGTCSTFCTTNYIISAGVNTVSGNDYFTLAFGDEIVGGLVDGFYAYYFEASSTSSPVNGWRIMEIQSNLVNDILVCDAGNNCVNP